MQHGDPTISPYLSVFRSVTPARQICQQCRARKVRCDGRPSTCHNCERLGFQCSLARPGELAPVPAKRPDTRPARLRGQNPCSQCRRRKVRCSNDYPECASCVKHGRSCSYLTSPVTRQWARDPGENPEQDPPTPRQQVSSPNATLAVYAPEVLGDSGLLSGLCTERTTQGDPSHQVATELIFNFFQHLYPVPSYAFLHPSTTLAKHRRGTLDQSLVLAICALTSLHVALPHPLLVDRRQSAEWVSTAEETIWKCLEHPSMPRLQALLLVISYRMATGGYEKAFMLMAIAARAASAMGLNHEHTELDPIAEETRRRSCLYLQPPSDEDSFSLLCPPGTEDFAIHTLAHHRELGSLNMCIRLVSIRRDIMKLTRELAVYSKPYLHLKTVTAGLEEAVLQLQTEMPSKGTTSTAYLKDLIKSPWLPRHIMMITLWHGCYFDLYRIFLPGYPEAPPDVVLSSIDVEFSQTARTTCVDHALAAVDLFCDLDQACTEPRMLELATGVCVYHAIRLILFVAHPLTELHMLNSEYAISRAEQCLAAMKRFFHGLALAQPIITDMAQLIATCSSNDPTTNSLFVFHQVNQSRKSDARVLSAAQPRQRLAVHSILQQARFPVEEPL